MSSPILWGPTQTASNLQQAIQSAVFAGIPTTTATAAGTTTLTIASNGFQQFTGTTTQTVVLPDATTLKVGWTYEITNRSTGVVTLNANGATLLQSMVGGSQVIATLITNGSAAGVWDIQYSVSNIASLLPGNLYWSGYYPQSGSNYWTVATSATFIDFTVVGTIPSPTALVNSGFTISKATSSLPGISFTAPRTGVIRIAVTASYVPGSATIQNIWAVKLQETTTSTYIAGCTGAVTANSTTDIAVTASFNGYFVATAATAYNFNLQATNLTAGVTAFIGAFTNNNQPCLSFAMEYIS